MKSSQYLTLCRNPAGNSQGSVLIALVVAMIVIGLLGAAVVSLQGTSSIHEVRANHAERAYNLAESGFRYAHSVWKETEDEDGDGDEVEDLLNGTSLDVPKGGQIKFVKVKYKKPKPNIFTVKEEYDAQSDILSIKNVDATYLPEYSGIFKVPKNENKSCTYRYLKFDNSTDTLNKVIPAAADDGCSVDDLNVGQKATSLEHLVVESRGSFPGSGDLNVNRTVTYWWPVSSGGSGQTIDVWEKFTDEEDIEKWVSTAGPGAMGDYEIDLNEEALAVTSVNPGLQETMRGFGGGDKIQSPDYDVQVKIKMGELDSYLAGITFRIQSDKLNPGGPNNKSFGVSFVKKEDGRSNTHGRGKPPGDGSPPDGLVPEDGRPYVIIWRDNGNPAAEKVKLLAWSSINNKSIVGNDGSIEDWSTLLLRIEQKKDKNNEKYNRIKVMVGDDFDSTTGNDNSLDGLRKSSFRKGVDLDHDGKKELPWPAKNIKGWSSKNDYFTIIEWDGSANGSSLQSQKINGKSADINLKTAYGEFLFDPELDLEVGLHTWGSNMAGNVFFDDFSIRALAEDEFIPPIQN